MSALVEADVERVLGALREGYGVEDIAAQGIATEESARRIVALLRKENLIGDLYDGARKKWRTAWHQSTK